MSDKLIYKIMFSIPVILIAIYVAPAVGIILIIAKQFITNKKWYSTPIALLIFSGIIYIPQILHRIVNLFNIKLDFIDKIISSSDYVGILNYSKTLFTIGFVMLILSAILSKVIENIGNKTNEVFDNHQKKQYEINKENDLKIKEKQLRSKTTSVVICDNCGASNVVTGKAGICPYCRTAFKNDNLA